MINKINSELAYLQEKLARKEKIKKQLQNLRCYQVDLENRALRLEKIKIKEDKDVKRVEGISFQALIYSIRGNKSQMIDKEKSEAYAATVKYENAVRELEDLYNQINSLEKELSDLGYVDDKYKLYMQQKINYVKEHSSCEVDEIIRLENKITGLEEKLMEIREAIAAGEKVVSKTDGVIKHLKDAKSYGTWDMLGGGLCSNLMKHSELDAAQAGVVSVQSALERFSKELKDVELECDADVDVRVKGTLGFADFFIDGFFTDMAVQNHIDESMSKITDIVSEVERTIMVLHEKKENLMTEKEMTKAQIENIAFHF